MFRNRIDVLCRFLLLLLLICSANGFARKDFKGLFGSYKPPKFVENDGNPSDFGINILLSTLLPVSSIVNSSSPPQGSGSSTPALADESLHFATFYNVELEPYVTFNYNWVLFGRIGWYTYQTERENALNGSEVQFHFFTIKAHPFLLGVRYRFSKNDVVPYVGLAAGMTYVERKASFGFNPISDIDASTVLTWEAHAGAEFYFGSRVGVRIELGVNQMLLKEGSFTDLDPDFFYKKSPITVRYSSGIFILF